MLKHDKQEAVRAEFEHTVDQRKCAFFRKISGGANDHAISIYTDGNLS